jgi:DNA-binding LytR/AlgR family response regulator
MKIGIVEDELLIAEKIKMILTELGYSTCEPVSGYREALEMISNENPDFLLLDINLGKQKTGIDIALHVNEHHRLPFIFLTANSDMATIESAKKANPFAYLVKPFTKDDLYAAIEIAINNFNTLRQHPVKKNDHPENKRYIFLKDNFRYTKINFSDIAIIESRENYVVIHTNNNKEISFRSTFNQFLMQLPAQNFLRVHRSFAIQTDLIENIENTGITVCGKTIPLSATYREALYEFLGIKH